MVSLFVHGEGKWQPSFSKHKEKRESSSEQKKRSRSERRKGKGWNYSAVPQEYVRFNLL